MSTGLLGTKVGMTQVFDEKGEVIPVTIIKVGPCYITGIKSIENCGYNAIQIGYIETSLDSKSITKPLKGHFLKLNISGYKYLKEYKKENIEDFKIGQKLTAEEFNVGENIKIRAKTIGKGNVGNIKRNNFNSGAKSHGSKSYRLQGSIGAGTSPGRVLPGKRMPGRLGMQQKTISGLKIVGIDLQHNLLVIKGSIPGKAGNLVNIMKLETIK